MHVPLLDRVANHVALVGASASQRVMPPAGIARNGQQSRAEIRHQPGAGRQIDIALLANRVLSAITVGIVSSVVEQRVDSLVPMQVHNAEMLAFLNFVNPKIAGGYGVPIAHVKPLYQAK